MSCVPVTYCCIANLPPNSGSTQQHVSSPLIGTLGRTWRGKRARQLGQLKGRGPLGNVRGVGRGHRSSSETAAHLAGGLMLAVDRELSWGREPGALVPIHVTGGEPQ